MFSTGTQFCRVCDGCDFVEDGVCGDRVCVECGTVDDMHIAFGYSWNEEERLGGETSGFGNSIGAEYGVSTDALSRSNKKMTETGLISLLEWDRLIELSVGSHPGIHHIIGETMKKLVRDVKSQHKLCGRSKETVIAALLYAAAFKHGNRDMTLEAACYFAACKNLKAARKMAKLLQQLSTTANRTVGVQLPGLKLPTGYRDLHKIVVAVCEQLKIDPSATDTALRITEAIRQNGVLEGYTLFDVSSLDLCLTFPLFASPRIICQNHRSLAHSLPILSLSLPYDGG
mmetsp:Transcript_17319/g.20799  ORF Transcript_17319/g.20799 Transcript_17319/m.20799 type:complete len:286 (-) Transcript_17319:145-1002(-)